MRVLIACERSGVVRRAFCKRWYETGCQGPFAAWSCDLEPAEDCAAAIFAVHAFRDKAWMFPGESELYARVGDRARVGSGAEIGEGAEIGSLARIPYKQVWIKSPLAVQGSRHLAGNYQPGMIQIGCQVHSFEYWTENAVKIGTANDYTPAEIAEYQRIIAFLVEIGVPAVKEGLL